MVSIDLKNRSTVPSIQKPPCGSFPERQLSCNWLLSQLNSPDVTWKSFFSNPLKIRLCPYIPIYILYHLISSYIPRYPHNSWWNSPRFPAADPRWQRCSLEVSLWRWLGRPAEGRLRWVWNHQLIPSGKRTKNYGKSPFIVNCRVKNGDVP